VANALSKQDEWYNQKHKRRNMQHYAEIEQLLESGAHFGHLTRRWNPKMEKFIFMERNGIHIIDLRKTQVLIDIAREALYNIASTGKIVLFVGTKLQAKGTIEQQALRCKMNYVCERWLGGMLTNFMTIRKSIKRLTSIDKMEVDGTFDKITKKERLLLTREKDRLRKVFGGIEEMNRLPGALFIVDIKKEHIAVKEAERLGIPIFGIVDTNSDPTNIDFVIPANDDATKSIEVILNALVGAIQEGLEERKLEKVEAETAEAPVVKERKSRVNKRPRTQREDDEALKANVVNKFIKEEED